MDLKRSVRDLIEEIGEITGYQITEKVLNRDAAMAVAAMAKQPQKAREFLVKAKSADPNLKLPPGTKVGTGASGGALERLAAKPSEGFGAMVLAPLVKMAVAEVDFPDAMPDEYMPGWTAKVEELIAQDLMGDNKIWQGMAIAIRNALGDLMKRNIQQGGAEPQATDTAKTGTDGAAQAGAQAGGEVRR